VSKGQEVVASTAREAAAWAAPHNIKVVGVVVEASGERVDVEQWGPIT
jgi:hypothetical protein